MEHSLRSAVAAVPVANRPVLRCVAGSGTMQAGWRGDAIAGLPVAHFLRSLRGRFDWRGDTGRHALMTVKYVVRSLLMFRQHGDYLALVEDEPMLQAFRRRDPRMLERHFHRYLNLGWSRHQRLRAIRQHYRHLLAAMPAPLFRAVYAEGGAPLGLLTLKDGSRLILSLRPPIFLGCEGELCIQLADELANPLYRIVVTVIDQHPTLVIGCLQGPVGTEARETVRVLTRNLHGMRPKCLMLALVRALARHWGIARVLAVGNAAHPLRSVRRRFVADYDAYWQEQQGRVVGGGWFELPMQPERKTEAAVPSQHRSAFRRREALRIEAERLLTWALGPMPERHRPRMSQPEMPGSRHPFQGVCVEVS
ncbi:VirK/YbjX family protein [Rhodanobacter sp. Si-c]|uniref:VirK/YbjX family protein n=1 Tax=Rhodanobacter lycopersici TaxID=3162487 RepID=A0ABV3QGS0_9GAMM